MQKINLLFNSNLIEGLKKIFPHAAVRAISNMYQRGESEEEINRVADDYSFYIAISPSICFTMICFMKIFFIISVNVTFYDMDTYITDIRWIPNTHYSGIHGLLKLLFPKIIPPTITKKILILDTDMTIVEDIYEIWKLFKKFDGYQVR